MAERPTGYDLCFPLRSEKGPDCRMTGIRPAALAGVRRKGVKEKGDEVNKQGQAKVRLGVHLIYRLKW